MHYTLPSVVVGLGNPGAAYEQTRHNVGFMVLDALASRRGAYWRQEKKFNAEVAQTNFGSVEGPGLRCWLVKPVTYMNASGESLRSFFGWHKVGVSSLVAVVDDASLPLGRIRIRASGSGGGHNGLLSIERELGTQQFARVRCGIGPQPAGRDLADWVLRPFLAEEEPALGRMVERAVAAVETSCSLGLTVAMNEYNKPDSLENGADAGG